MIRPKKYVFFPQAIAPWSLALLSGIAMGLTSAPINGWPLAWVAQAPLWGLIYKHSLPLLQNPPQSVHSPPPPLASRLPFLILIACLWSLGYYGVTIAWITGLHPLTWMGVPWLGSVAIAFICWLLITVWGCVWTVVWAGSLAWVTRRYLSKATVIHGWGRVLVGTALWCGLDTLWSQGILYWPTLAFTQSPHNLWILHLNQLSGPVTTTAVIAAVNGLLAEVWAMRGLSSSSFADHFISSFADHSIGAQPLSKARTMILSTISVVAIAHLLGAWLYFRPVALSSPLPSSAVSPSTVIPPDSEQLSIGLIQGNIPTRIKLTGDGIRHAFNRYTDSYLTLAEQGADLVLMPEGALPVLWRTDGDTRNPVAQAVGDRHVPAIVGTFVSGDSGLGDSGTNDNRPSQTITQSLLMVTSVNAPSPSPKTSQANLTPQINTAPAQVTVESQYNKVKLVPLGEYIPAEGLLGAIITRLSPIQSSMVPGRVGQIFETPFGRAIAGICYESAFPELFRRQTASGGEFMITASNNDPYNGAMMAQHHAQDVMRAIESDRWMVRVTNTGYSGVVSPQGQTMWRSQRNTYETHIATISRRQTQTLYVRWGNWLTPLLIGVAIIVVAKSKV